ncbi:methionine--tRNA ligase [Candidatus Nomurabacteria bacterium]|nr:methionine--tRNA ligase [Candidatus Nomurabacteria bacterium]
MSKPFYLTTTLPYVNAEPHIGFALEIVQADIIARYHLLLGDEIFFNTGTDEHGLKIYKKAQELGRPTQEYVDEYAEKFKNLQKHLGLSDNLNFIRTTDPGHMEAARRFWEICERNNFIYKKNYQVKYCVGCELEKTESELEDGRCPIHPNLEVELIDEENYFFKFKAFEQDLLKLYERPNFVLPQSRLNEIKAFVGRGLEDFSISRLASKMPWGVPVPNDPDHVMSVWFDALVNYISALGWPNDLEKFEKFWGTKESPNAVQFAGKDNLRQQSAMWQAMLLAAGLPTSKQIVIHGFINVDGQKMSKSLGNVIDPIKLVEEYGTDAVRYYLARHVNPFEDSDFTLEKFKEAYNANLANGLGNLVSRVMKMAEVNNIKSDVNFEIDKELFGEMKNIDSFEFNKEMDAIWKYISDVDNFIQNHKPFELIKTNRPQAEEDIKLVLRWLARIAMWLRPFMPSSAEKIRTAICENKMPEALFRRKD